MAICHQVTSGLSRIVMVRGQLVTNGIKKMSLVVSGDFHGDKWKKIPVVARGNKWDKMFGIAAINRE